MVARQWVVVVLLGAVASLGAQFRTKNFIVEAATPQLAERFGQWAEHYRKQKAILWLGQEMPTWGRPCPLNIKVQDSGSGGATSFGFDNGQILSIDMRVEGKVDRLVASVLPHEVTHTVLAYYFRVPVPRWADEGGAVLSEDEQERNRHDGLVRQILATPSRRIPLDRLFKLTTYPRDVMVLYAEGYSVTNFLVGKSNRTVFLNFVRDGMNRGWDQAVQTHYHYRNVNELEEAWIQHLRNTPRAPGAIASAGGHRPGIDAEPSAGSGFAHSETGLGRVVVRQTLPPAFPVLGAPRPVVRGVAASSEPGVSRPVAEGWATPSAAPPSGTLFMGASAPPGPPPVRLGTPQPPSWGRLSGSESP